MHSFLSLHVPEQIIGSCILQSSQGKSLSEISGSIARIRKEVLDSRLVSDFVSFQLQESWNETNLLGFVAALKC